MGKRLMGALFVVGLLFLMTGCMKKETINPAVEAYLQEAAKATLGDVAVKKGDNIVVDYIGRLDDGNVFDTSVESVAKATGKYQSGRNYQEGLPFQVGAGQMIAGFDTAVVDMKINETKTISIPPAQAYGEWDETKVFSVEKSKIQDPEQYKEGMELMGPYGQKIKVQKVTNTEVFLDANHELAGKTLIFDITIKEIK